MRKLLLLLAMAATMAGQAQTSAVNDCSLQADETLAAMQAQPRLVSDTAYKWALGDGEYGNLGNKQPGTFSVAIKVPGKGFLMGGKAVSVNLPVIYTGMTDVKVWGKKSLSSAENIFAIDVADNTLAPGYNEIALDEPYEINQDFYLGYTFTVENVSTAEAQYPIGVFRTAAANALYLDFGQGFEDCSARGYGVSALQLFVEGLRIVDYGAKFVYDDFMNSFPSTPCTLEAEVMQLGQIRISKIEYTLTVGGQTETRSQLLSVSGAGNTAKLKVNYTSPAETAAYSVDLQITKINGQDNQRDEITQVWGQNLSRRATRKVLVEELTGTGCGYCPRGWVGMEAIKTDMAETVVPIAVHQYNSDDPMFLADYAWLAIPGAPGVQINRSEVMDPYYGSTKNPYGIKDDINAHVDDITAIDILSVSGVYNEDKTEVEAKANLEFLGGLGQYTVEFVLTADSLSGNNPAWRQSNYYSQSTPGQASVVARLEPELATFCKGGERGQSMVFLTFNDVAIASSYQNGENMVPALPEEFKATDQVSPTYTLTMPTRQNIKNAIRTDLVFVNVLVFDHRGLCINAARGRVLTQEEVEGIEQIYSDADSVKERRYNLAGQRVNAGYKGFAVVNGKKQVVIE